MKLAFFELQKLFGRKLVTAGLLLVAAANLVLMQISSDAENAAANRRLMSEIGELPLGEKQSFVAEKYADTLALIRIDEYLKFGVPENESESFRQLVGEYRGLYEAGGDQLFTGNLYSDADFFAAVRSELETVAHYPDYLQDIQNQANQFGKISIFQNNNIYAERNIQKTADDFRHLLRHNLTLDYFPQKGVITAITFEYTDLFLLISMLLLAGVIISAERDSGMFHYVRAAARGRAGTALAKYLTLAAASFFLVLLLYGSNLVYCAVRYGIGPLSRSIQSLPFFMRSTLLISVFEYLVLFFFVKWFSVCILGLAVMLIVLAARRFLSGVLLSFLFYGAELLQYAVIRPNTSLSVAKYINIAGILRVNDWIGEYLNYNVFGRPVTRFSVVSISAVVFLTLLFVSFIAVYRLRFPPKSAPGAWVRKQPPKSTTVFKEEIHKTFVIGGVAAVLLILLAVQLWQGFSRENLITADEIYYRHYMIPLSGKYTQETYDYLLRERASDAFQETYEMDRLYAIKAISQQEYDSYHSRNYGVYKRRDAFEQVVNTHVNYVLANPGAQLVYESGYEILFDKNDTRDLADTFLSGLMITVCLCNLFAQEKSSGMQRVLEATPLGRRVLIKNKLLLALIVSVLLAGILMSGRLIQVIKDYGLPAFWAPAKSLSEYDLLPGWIKIASLSVFSFMARCLSNLFFSMVIILLSKKFNYALSVIFIGFLLFSAPALLAMLGMDTMRFLSAYPLFHLPQMFTTGTGIAYVLLLTGGILLYGYIFLTDIGFLHPAKKDG